MCGAGQRNAQKPVGGPSSFKYRVVKTVQFRRITNRAAPPRTTFNGRYAHRTRPVRVHRRSFYPQFRDPLLAALRREHNLLKLRTSHAIALRSVKAADFTIILFLRCSSKYAFSSPVRKHAQGTRETRAILAIRYRSCIPIPSDRCTSRRIFASIRPIKFLRNQRI